MSLGWFTFFIKPLRQLAPRRLSRQLLACSCLVTILLGLTFSLIRLNLQQRSEIDQAETRIARVIEQLQTDLPNQLNEHGKARIEDAVANHASTPNVAGIFVYGADLSIIGSHQHLDHDAARPMSSLEFMRPLLHAAMDRHLVQEKYFSSDSGLVLLRVSPILDQSRQPVRALGAVAVGVQLPPICQLNWTDLSLMLATVITESLLMVLGLWLLLHKLVVSPLEQLHMAAHRTSVTVPFELPPLKVRNEIFDLAHEFAKAFSELDLSRASIQKLAIVAQHTDNMVIITDAHGSTEWVNESFTRLTGYTIDEMRGKYPGSILRGPKSDPATSKLIEERVNQGKPVEAEIINYKKSGEEYWVNMNIKPVRDAAGQLQNFVAVQRDVTKQREAQESLHRNVERYRGLIESQLDLILRLDPLGRITFANQAFGKAIGSGCEQLLGRDLLGMISSSMQEQTRKSLEAVKQPPHRVSFENLLNSVQGPRWICWESCAVLDDAGNLQEIQAVGRDVTALKETQRNVEQFAEDLWATRTKLEMQTHELAVKARELEAARAAAESASQSKSSFLANMSHEIRTPMTAVLGYSELLLDPQQTSDERHNCVRIIRRNGEHLLSLINDILDISKIEAGKMIIEEVPTSIQQLVADVESLMRARAQDKGLTFETRILTPLPPAIMTDPTRVRQILVNLVGNAIKFTQTGHVQLHVSVHTQKISDRGLTIQFQVTDSGIGISPAQQALLFQPFSQADSSTTRKFGGTGLGLTISRRLAQMLGGEITLRSRTGQGSTFTVTIHASRAKDQQTAASLPGSTGWIENSTEGAPIAAPSLRGGRIMLAEDGDDNRALLTLFLTRAGATVQSVNNGKVAVEQAMASLEQGNPFDLILMDMQMPELDGYSATTMLRSRGYTGKIIALTAHAMATDRLRCLSIGCDDFISKPVQRDRLISLVASHLLSSPQRPAPAAAPSPAPQVTPVQTLPAHGVEMISETAASNNELGPAADAEFAEIVSQFTRVLPERAREINDMLQSQDLVALARLAHQLKGAAGGFGFPHITEQSAMIEKAAIDHDMDTLMASVAELKELCRSAAATPPASTLPN